MYCKKCGIKLDTNAQYCTVCGTKVDEMIKETLEKEKSSPNKNSFMSMASPNSNTMGRNLKIGIFTGLFSFFAILLLLVVTKGKEETDTTVDSSTNAKDDYVKEEVMDEEFTYEYNDTQAVAEVSDREDSIIPSVTYTIGIVNSGHINPNERFNFNPEYNNGHKELTISYDSYLCSDDKYIKLQREFLSVDMFYMDNGRIDDHAYISMNGGDSAYYNRGYFTYDVLYEDTVIFDGYRKTMNITLKNNVNEDYNALQLYVSVSPVEEEVRDFLRFSLFFYDREPNDKDIEVFCDACKKSFDSLRVDSYVIGATE